MTAIAAIAVRGAGHLAKAQPFPVTRQHEAALMLSLERPAQSIAQLIDRGDLAVILEELRAALAARPAPEREAQAVVLALVGSYPQAPANAEIYLAALAGEASRWPVEVLHEARRVVSRRSRYLPTVAELADACDAIQARRRSLLIAAERQEREHQRRAEQARQQAARAAEIDADTIALHAGLRNTFGLLAIDASDFPDAQRGMLFARNISGAHLRRDAGAWLSAYRAAEPWAVVAARRAWVLGRALLLHHSEVLNLPALCAVASCLSQGDEPGALQLVEQAEAGKLSSDDCAEGDRAILRTLIGQALDRDACEAAALELRR